MAFVHWEEWPGLTITCQHILLCHQIAWDILATQVSTFTIHLHRVVVSHAFILYLLFFTVKLISFFLTKLRNHHSEIELNFTPFILNIVSTQRTRRKSHVWLKTELLQHQEQSRILKLCVEVWFEKWIILWIWYFRLRIELSWTNKYETY